MIEREVTAWVARRNTHNVEADWHFTAADARVKLTSLYPALQAIQATGALGRLQPLPWRRRLDKGSRLP